MTQDTSMTPGRVNAAAMDRATRAAAMRTAGIPWARVAAELEYANPQNAMRAVRSFYAALPAPDRETARGLLRDRAEAVWRQVQLDMRDQRPGATRAAIAVLQRMAALDGLDEASRLEIHPSAEAYSATVRALLQQHQAQLGQGAAVEGDPFDDSEDYIDVEVVDEPTLVTET